MPRPYTHLFQEQLSALNNYSVLTKGVRGSIVDFRHSDIVTLAFQTMTAKRKVKVKRVESSCGKSGDREWPHSPSKQKGFAKHGHS